MYLRGMKIANLNLVLRMFKYEPLSTYSISCNFKISGDDVVVGICKRDGSKVEERVERKEIFTLGIDFLV